MAERQSTSSKTTVTVELFGMPRVIAGTDHVHLEAATLRETLGRLLRLHPKLSEHILNADGRWLNSGYVFVVNGTFTSNPDQLLTSQSDVFLVSRASGG